jgi:hypothetical protein
MGRSFWQKVEEAKMKGITAEQFEKVENLESAIAYHQDKIDEYEKEIKNIENATNSKLERIGV